MLAAEPHFEAHKPINCGGDADTRSDRTGRRHPRHVGAGGTDHGHAMGLVKLAADQIEHRSSREASRGPTLEMLARQTANIFPTAKGATVLSP